MAHTWKLVKWVWINQRYNRKSKTGFQLYDRQSYSKQVEQQVGWWVEVSAPFSHLHSENQGPQRWRSCCSQLADLSLHHKTTLKVTNPVAAERFALLHSWGRAEGGRGVRNRPATASNKLPQGWKTGSKWRMRDGRCKKNVLWRVCSGECEGVWRVWLWSWNLSPGEQRTQDVVPALQLEGVFAATQVVDVLSQPVHVLQTLCHNHLLVHQVGLWQVRSGLGTGTEGQWYICPARREEFCWMFLLELLLLRSSRRSRSPPDQGYLEVGQQLPQVSGWHHDGGVELDDVALVQPQVVVGGQILR